MKWIDRGENPLPQDRIHLGQASAVLPALEWSCCVELGKQLRQSWLGER